MILVCNIQGSGGVALVCDVEVGRAVASVCDIHGIAWSGISLYILFIGIKLVCGVG